jgi:hypothetical protein
VTSVGKESDGGTSEEVPIEPCVLDFYTWNLSISIYVFREFSYKNYSSVDESEDGDDTDVAEAGHVSDEREWEEDQEGGWATLHGTILPGSEELEVVLGADSTFLEEARY